MNENVWQLEGAAGTYLFDQHVEVLGDVGCQTCNVTLSVIEDQSRGFAAAICGDEGRGFPRSDV
jgi:hypothetical protein